MNDHAVRKSLRVLAVLVLCAAALVATLGSVRAKSATGTTGAEAAVATQQGGPALSNVFIVQLEGDPLSVYNGGIEGLEATNPAARGQIKLDVEAPASVAYLSHLDGIQSGVLATIEGALGRPVEVVFRYQVVYNGLAIRLDSDAEANVVAGVPGVVMVQRETIETLDTDVGPAFIGATAIWDGTGVPSGTGTMGEGIVAGVLDTGVNFDSPSFADIGPVDGYDHTNPYGAGVYKGWCATNAGCNDKLVGAYTFVTEPTTPEDSDGHGSHTASTVVGNVVDATISAGGGFSATRRVRGVAPHANLIAYDVCIDTCPGSALLAAANQAAADMVDVINYSISGGNSPYSDPVEQAFLNATNVGVFVSTSAGNAGTVSSVAHRSPWVSTTAASTHNRKWVNSVDSLSGGGPTPPPQPIVGAGFAGGTGVLPLVYAGDVMANPLCLAGVWPAGTFTNQIVVCDRGTNGRVEKGEVVLAAGGDGMILVNDAANGNSVSADVHALPAVHIGNAIGTQLKAWMAAGPNPMGRIVGGTENLDMANGDIMASFSSMGPATNIDIIKPDITAPGVDIWAAYAGPSTSYNFVSGTSMSSPHNAGAAALMSDVYPTWSTSALKSAMMSTADTTVTKRDGVTQADWFDFGAGRVDLTRAARVGFVLNITHAEYVASNPASGGDPRTLNLPSMQNSQGGGTSAWNFGSVTFTPNAGPVSQHMPIAWRAESCDTETCSWTRRLTSVWPTAVSYTAATSNPGGIQVSPSSFTLAPGATQEVVITIGAPTAVTLGTLESGTSTTLPLALALGTALVAMAGLVALRRNRA